MKLTPAEQFIMEYAKKYVAHIPVSENQRIPHLKKTEDAIGVLLGTNTWYCTTKKGEKHIVVFGRMPNNKPESKGVLLFACDTRALTLEWY